MDATTTDLTPEQTWTAAGITCPLPPSGAAVEWARDQVKIPPPAGQPDCAGPPQRGGSAHNPGT